MKNYYCFTCSQLCQDWLVLVLTLPCQQGLQKAYPLVLRVCWKERRRKKKRGKKGSSKHYHLSQKAHTLTAEETEDLAADCNTHRPPFGCCTYSEDTQASYPSLPCVRLGLAVEASYPSDAFQPYGCSEWADQALMTGGPH